MPHCACGAPKRDGACIFGCERFLSKRDAERRDAARAKRLRRQEKAAEKVSVDPKKIPALGRGGWR